MDDIIAWQVVATIDQQQYLQGSFGILPVVPLESASLYAG